MSAIEIWKASIAQLDDDIEKYLQKIPENWRNEIIKYVQIADQKRALLARLMLFELLIQKNCCTDFTFNEWGKPFINGAPFFNWSHSGDYVIFAWSKTVEVGVDVEQINDIKISDFKGTFSEVQWKTISKSETPRETFYYYWALNEALIKSLGKGLSFDLKTLEIPKDNLMLVDDDLYVLKKIEVDSNYMAFLAFKKGHKEIIISSKPFHFLYRKK